MSSHTQPRDTALAELIRFSLRVSMVKPPRRRSRLWLKTAQPHFSEPSNMEECSSYAAPLAPLHERDKTALSGFFERDDMEEIASDVKQTLAWLWPEPCWDEEPYEFLKEFL